MPNSLPILVVGGFGTSWQTYQPFRRILAQVSKRPVFVTRLETLEWLSVIVTDDYSHLLKRLNMAVTDTLRRTDSKRLLLLGHSAGGVLARIYLGDQPYGREQLVYHGFQRVATLVTLGTPHTTPTRGRLGGLNQITFVETHYPGAYWRFLHYGTVISRSIFGSQSGSPHERNAWNSYTMLTDEGAQWGDGVVPLSCAVLEGAHHVELDGVRHDPLPDERPWYGHNEDVVRSWWSHVEHIEREPVRGQARDTAEEETTEEETTEEETS